MKVLLPSFGLNLHTACPAVFSISSLKHILSTLLYKISKNRLHLKKKKSGLNILHVFTLLKADTYSTRTETFVLSPRAASPGLGVLAACSQHIIWAEPFFSCGVRQLLCDWSENF